MRFGSGKNSSGYPLQRGAFVHSDVGSAGGTFDSDLKFRMVEREHWMQPSPSRAKIYASSSLEVSVEIRIESSVLT